MSDVYNNSAAAAAARYDTARRLPDATQRQWAALLTSHIPGGISRALDLGCGTGRFTALLADTFKCSVIGVEPAAAMAEIAKQTLQDHATIEVRTGQAEALPLEEDAVELVFMSQVYHHLERPLRALQEVRRVLRAGGWLIVRTSTQEANRDAPWLPFFPEAHRIEDARVPSRAGIVETAAQVGFGCHHIEGVRQRFAESPREYAGKIGRRGLSSLVSISDEASERGLARLQSWAETQPEVPINETVDLLVFQKLRPT
jgi:ubiquinone/menaquinone biosynthesis C-methylase UbiE